MSNLVIVTTSWDDGDPSDLRIAKMLRSRGLLGTFYVPIIGYNGGPTLPSSALKELSAEGFEIGAHGVSHNTLSFLRGIEARREVTHCKRLLEDTLAEQVAMFSYPRGKYNRAIVRSLKSAGYEGARTTQMLSTEANANCFRMPTTLHAYPHNAKAYVRNALSSGHPMRLVSHSAFLRAGWVDLGKALFDHVLAHGGVWHLFGHSWEIEKECLWAQLGDLLDYVSARSGVLYGTNRQILKHRRPHVQVNAESLARV